MKRSLHPKPGIVDLQETRQCMKTANDAVPSLGKCFGQIDLIDIIDTRVIQSMMDDFYHLTKIGVAIVDLKGDVLVATGWQDVCTQFHRKHPETLKNCIESDLELSTGIEPGFFRAYRCKNNMWDIATPIVVGGHHVGNLFLGQFFYEGEVPDSEYFQSQAKSYDFDLTAYLSALDRVPRWSKETVQTVMRFYAQFTDLISKLSYSNLRLDHELSAHEATIKSLKKSEEKLRAIFNASPLAMVLLDREGCILDSNEVHAKRINVTREQILGKRIWELLPEEVSASRKKHVQGVFETGKPFSGEDQRGKNWIQYHIHPAVLDKNGKVDAVIVEAVDITDRKKSEKQIAEALSWYQEIFEGSKDAIFISDENARFISVNNAACELTGYNPEELTSMRIPDLHDEMDLGAFNAFHARIIGGDPIDSEARILCKDGRKVEAEFNNKRITVSGKYYMHSTARDISDRKLSETALRISEEALRESEEKYRILFEHTGEALFVAQDGMIAFQNPRSLELTGYSAEEFQSKPFVDFIHEDDREMVMDRHLRRLRKEKLPEQYSFRIIHKSGSILWVQINVVVIQWDGKPATLNFMSDITDRKKAEEAIKEKTQLLQNITDNMFDLVSLTDMKGNFIFLSASHKILNYDLDSLIGKNVLEFVHPENLPEISSAFNDFPFKCDDKRRFEYQCRCSDGSYLWFETVGRLIRDDKEKPKEILFSTRDVTGRKRVEKKLVKEATRRHILMEQSRDGIVILDQTGQVIESNRRFADMLGYPFESMYQLKVFDWEFQHPPDCINEMISRVDEKGDHFETKHRRKDGSIYDVEISTNAAWFDGQKLIFCICRDISERKKQEEKLLDSEERFRTVFEQAAVGIARVSADGFFQELNDKFYQIIGYDKNELYSMTFEDITHPDDLYLEEKYIKRVLKGEIDSFEIEKRYLHKKGHSVWVKLFSNVVRNVDRQIKYAVAIVTDISKQKQVEEEQETLQNRLNQAQKMESIGNLAGGIAHDFNNLLFPIIGLAEMLAEDLPHNSPEQVNAHEIIKAGQRAADLVKQILAFSRQQEHKLIPVRIQHILKEVLKLSRSTIPMNIKMDHHFQQECGLILADPTQIHQIAMNLITNAYHAVENSDGRISVQVQEVVLDINDTSDMSIEPGKYAMLSVEDNGYGITPAHIQKIFDPYFTTKEQGKGTGLGLAVVYGIIKEYKGDIKVRSKLGKGTVFKVYLPLMPDTKVTESDTKQIQFEGGTGRILLIDDELAIARLEKQMLERLGYTVSELTSSADALQAFKNHPDAYDLVITDMSMPNMTGDKLAREILLIRPNMPIIICTGFSEKMNADVAKNIGVKGLLMKPVVKSEMAQMVQKALVEKRSC